MPTPISNLLNPSLGIQNVLDMPVTGQTGMPHARQIASNVLREAGLEELYAPSNAAQVTENALCPDVGDGDVLRPEVFAANLRGCAEAMQDSGSPAVRQMLREDLNPLLENNDLLKAYMGLMIGG